MYRLNQEHRHTIVQYTTNYSETYKFNRIITLKSEIPKKTVVIDYYPTNDSLIIHGLSHKMYAANKIYDSKRTAEVVGCYLKDIEGFNVSHTEDIPEEEQRQFIKALNNLFELEDTGLTKRAL